MISKTLLLLSFAAAVVLSSLFTGCAAPPAGDGDADIDSRVISPDPYQQQAARQEAISRQQRSLMR